MPSATFTRLDRSGARAERSTVASVFTDAYAAAIASGDSFETDFLPLAKSSGLLCSAGQRGTRPIVPTCEISRRIWARIRHDQVWSGRTGARSASSSRTESASQ